MKLHNAESVHVGQTASVRGSTRLAIWAAMAILLALALFAAQAYASNLPSTQLVGAGAGDGASVAGPSLEFQAAQLPQMAVGDVCYERSDSATFLVGSSGAVPSVPGFDSSLGTLSSVSVGTSAHITSKGWVRNDSEDPFDFVIISSGFKAGISGPGIEGSAVEDYISDVVPVPKNPNLPDPYDPTQPKPLGVETPVDLISATDRDVAIPSVLTAYESTSVDFPATSSGFYLVNAPPDGGIQVESLVHVSVTVTYCYTPAAPMTSAITISSSIELGGSTGILTPTATYAVSCTNGYSGSPSILGTDSTIIDIGVAPAGTSCEVTQTIDSPAEWSTMVNGVCGSTTTINADGTAAFANVLTASGSATC